MFDVRLLVTILVSLQISLYISFDPCFAIPNETDVNKILPDLISSKGVESSANTTNSKKLVSLLDWNAFVRFFDKRYSTLTQKLVRQKLFLARVLEVFITGTKYRLYQLSYYTSINKWSDLTNEEREELVSGDLSNLNQPASDSNKMSADDNLITDDELARKILLKELAKNEKSSLSTIEEELRSEREEALGKSKNQLDRGVYRYSRRRRDASGAHDHDSMRRDLGVADLILVNSQPVAPNPNLHIKWVVSPGNEHYQKPKLAPTPVNGEDFHKSDVKDIPKDQMREITQATTNITAAGVLKSAFNSSINWWSKEKENSSLEKNSTIVIRDWRKSGCIGPARDQGYCASCYAIASMGFVEWAFCENQNQILTPLSPQYMVSCGPQLRDETRGDIKLEGCRYGMSRQTMDFVKEYGIELEVNMPYSERETVCPIEPNTPRKYKGYIRPNVKPTLRLSGSTSQLDLALKKGPVIVSMREPVDFLSYGGGLVEHCDPFGGHAMLVVGNMIEDGVEYLLIKNSFGTYWGYGGFFKFRRSAMKECVKEFIVPMISFPGKKAQARRIKAYLAQRQSNASEETLDEDDEYVDASDEEDDEEYFLDATENTTV